MDLLTQGVLGATIAQAGSSAKQARLATAVGFFAGLLADADTLIRSEQDTLLNLEFHRHFSHSIFFVPIGALLAAFLLWPFLRKKIAFSRLYLFSFLGYSCSGLLDACTSYGTMLLWPLYDERISWNVISIVDPLFTLTLIACIALGLRQLRPHWARVGMVFMVGYMLFGWSQNQRAEQVVQELALQRGHGEPQILVKPTMANQWLWRTIYKVDDQFYVDAVRLGMFSGDRIYPGTAVKVIDQQALQKIAREGSVLARDLQRFNYFSSGYIAFYPDKANVIGDIRYSMLPNDIRPIWGIELPADDSQHAVFSNYREDLRHARKVFVAMLLGRDLPLSQ